MDSIILFFSELWGLLNVSVIMSLLALFFMLLSCLIYKSKGISKIASTLHYVFVCFAAGFSVMSLFLAAKNNMSLFDAFMSLICVCVSIIAAFTTVFIEEKKFYILCIVIFCLCVISTSLFVNI